MNRIRHTMTGLSLAALLFSCSENAEEPRGIRAIEFSISGDRDGGSSRAGAGSPAVFGKGDRIGVYACYRPKADADQGAPFTANFMNNQIVTFDGSEWSYSPLKYWPVDGSVEFYGYFPYNADQSGINETITHECRTGLEPLYGAHSVVKADNGSLSGDGISGNGRLQLGFTPMLNKVNFSAKADDNLFDEVENEEFKDCRFLIREFRVWGFYSVARCNTADGSWTGQHTPYTVENPLDMTEYLDRVDTGTAIEGYVYDPDNGYCTDKAVVVVEAADAVNMFGKSAHFIPMDGVIPGNEPGFEIVYVVLTNKQGENVYKESGIVTRRGSLREIFDGRKGLIRKVINVNLTFSVDGVTVTRDLVDYKYKPMF